MRSAFIWLKNERRLRIVLWAIFFGVVCGLSEFGLPAEDGLRAVRNEIAKRPADKSVTVVAIDDRTMNRIKGSNPSRSEDAKVINSLFARGAKRIFYDRAFADETNPIEDLALKHAFESHKGRIFIGARPEDIEKSREAILPLPLYRKAVEIRSLWGEASPFGLATRFPFRSRIQGQSLPSLSAELARKPDNTDAFYRLDFSIDYATVPTVSYIDLVDARAPNQLIAGKDIVFGYTAIAAHDLHAIPFRGDVPGVFFHVIGAQTLKEGAPLELGWLPAFLIAIISVSSLYRSTRFSARKISGLTAGALCAVPFVLPSVSLSMDIMPAMLTIGIAGIRLARYERKMQNGESGLPTIAYLRQQTIVGDQHVFAMKIRNYASLKASANQNIERALMNEMSRRIRLSSISTTIAHQGDTLVWVSPVLTASELRNHAHGLHAILASGAEVSGVVVDIAVSIGIDVNQKEPAGARIDAAMQCAEDAALSATICKIGAVKSATDRSWDVQILAQLEMAITSGQLWVAYQPKVSLKTNEQMGAEALIRWTHPDRGQIEPSSFIPIAEHHNRMEPLTTFVLDAALATLKKATVVQPGFKMSVNLSTQMLRTDRILMIIEAAVRKHDVRADQVVIEITETAPIETDDDALAILARMKAMGLQLSIDDFGMGNATLEYLVKIPANEVKIDRMFVTNLLDGTSNPELARSIIKMAHSQGCSVVAEGIETAEVARALKQMGCDEGQGYLFDKPLSADALLSRLIRTKIAA